MKYVSAMFNSLDSCYFIFNLFLYLVSYVIYLVWLLWSKNEWLAGKTNHHEKFLGVQVLEDRERAISDEETLMSWVRQLQDMLSSINTLTW